MRQLKIGPSITSRGSDAFEKYLQQVGKIDLITPEEEVRLAVRIHQGDERAKEKLVRANLRFVVSVAKQYQNQGLFLQDLVNEGNLGLVKAAGLFDETRGFKFISYAVWWIRQSILQALTETARIVRVPFNKVTLSHLITETSDQFIQDYEREPSSDELAELLDLEVDAVEHTMWVVDRHVSLDAPLQESETVTLLEILGNPNAEVNDPGLSSESLRSEIQRIVNMLPEKQRYIVKLYFGLGVKNSLSLEDIGKKFSLSSARVRQIRDKAISRIRTSCHAETLKTYLG